MDGEAGGCSQAVVEFAEPSTQASVEVIVRNDPEQNLSRA